jgi:LAO/AO transport system kinase
MDAATAHAAAKAGDRRSLARLLTLIETGEANGVQLGFSSRAEDGRILGVTGSPGVGKSCLVDRLLHEWAAAGERVAVLAIDPSSPVTGGALLGDRIRMQAADDLDEVYVRSVATRNQPGGLPVRLAAMAEALLDCGYDRVVVETVGTGQAEVRIVAVADRVLLVEGPARGDSIQAEKAGLLELVDIVAVNKADLDGADRFAEEIRGSLELTGEAPPVLLVSALEGTGIPELVSALGQLGPARVAQRARWRERLLSEWEAALLTREDLDELLDRLESGDTSVSDIVGTFYRGGG